MKTKTNLQTELVALTSHAGDPSNILAWPERGKGVAFDGANNPMEVTLDKATTLTARNSHLAIPDGSRVNAVIVKRSEAIKTYLPILEKAIAAAADDPEPAKVSDKPWAADAHPRMPPAIPKS